MSLEREVQVEAVIDGAVDAVYRLIWILGDLTPAESRLVWLKVAEKLIQSAVIDRQSDVVKEWLKT